VTPPDDLALARAKRTGEAPRGFCPVCLREGKGLIRFREHDMEQLLRCSLKNTNKEPA
jgi:hypothetical protein